MANFSYTPAAPLNSYIDHITYLDGPAPYPREKIFPTPWLTMHINLGDPFCAYETDRPAPFGSYTHSWVVGLRSAYHTVDWPTRLKCFLIDFKPGGAYPFLTVPLDELRREVVLLDALWGRSASELHERLATAPTLSSQFTLLEQALLAHLAATPHGLATIRVAIEQIAQQRGSISIRRLASELGFSQKHLITQFRRLVGAPPKELARLIRFREILRNLEIAQPVRWTQIARHFRYSDQSHFNRDFSRFTGLTPTDYRRLCCRIHLENPTHALARRQLPTG
jgi:AraC-like DNA-binding protein